MGHRVIKQKKGGGMAKFRFQDLRIWQSSIQIADELFDLADKLERMKLYRFAEQLWGKEFKLFLNVARRSAFENANILILLRRRNILDETTLKKHLDQLDCLCRQITNFRDSLK
jgi:hypothetical protein